MGILTTALGNLRDSAKDAWEQAKDLVRDIGTSAVDTLNNWSDSITDAAHGFGDAVEDKFNDISDSVSDYFDNPDTIGGKIADALNPSTPKPGRPSRPSGGDDDGGSGNSGAPSASQLDYLYADLSKHYKMDAATAFQEALANTEYTRSVADMKRAGLNPAAIFGGGSRGGNGANSNIHGNLLSAGGGSGGSRRGYYSSAGSRGYAFNSSAYSFFSAIGGLAGAAITKNPGGYWIGSAVAQGAMNAVNLVKDWLKK